MAYNSINGFSVGYNAYNIPPAKDSDLNVRQEPVIEQGAVEGPKPLRENIFGESVSLTIGTSEADSSYMTRGGLASEDMRRAISNMHKDSILREYQYFVGKDLSGKESNIVASTDDGVVVKLS
ncbi:MAG: hypothetical protein IKZ97_02690 [Butyrivibrio sp.]|nr:hypothetical protein [Butyrivibrio sp.]